MLFTSEYVTQLYVSFAKTVEIADSSISLLININDSTITLSDAEVLGLVTLKTHFLKQTAQFALVGQTSRRYWKSMWSSRAV